MNINDDKTMMLNCSFCNKNQKNVKDILASEYEVCICDECLYTCMGILKNKELDLMFANVAPRDIYTFLDKYVIGQDRAKKVIAVSVYDHYHRILRKYSRDPEIEILKSNVLMIGSTGSGKTFLIRTLAKTLGIPIAMIDATALTETGYVGEDVESILSRLLVEANGNVNKAEKGIVYIDEIDKTSRRVENMSSNRDISGEGVQQGLLKIIEGTSVLVPPVGMRKHFQQQCVEISTRDILFIFSGSFSGLKEIVAKKLELNNFGFTNNIHNNNNNNIKKKKPSNNVDSADLIKFGMIPEFIGRIPHIVVFDDLTIGILIRILNEPKNSLMRQYKKIFIYHGIKLIIKNSAQKEIARRTINRKMGARGMKSIIDNLLLDVMFIIPSQRNIKTIIIDYDIVDVNFDNSKMAHVSIDENNIKLA